MTQLVSYQLVTDLCVLYYRVVKNVLDSVLLTVLHQDTTRLLLDMIQHQPSLLEPCPAMCYKSLSKASGGLGGCTILRENVSATSYGVRMPSFLLITRTHWLTCNMIDMI